MADSSHNESPRFGESAQFTTTHWSVVLAAGQSDSSTVRDALEQLCRIYWYPLYAYVRRKGYSPLDSQDLTQAFFAHLLDRNFLEKVSREKGKFRSFLLASLKNFLSDEWDRARAQKRGGDRVFISLDDTSAEALYHHEPADTLDAEKIYERRWAMTLLQQVLRRLEDEYAAADKREIFQRLHVFLTGDKRAVSYAETAIQLEMSEGALKVAVHRMRKRYRELFREEIGHTVGNPAEIDDETRHLIAVIST